jgi:hypothetical protein
MPRRLTRIAVTVLAAILFAALPALAQAPVVSQVTPSAAVPGGATDVLIGGNDLRGVTLWTSFSAESAPQAGEDASTAKLRLTVAPDTPLGIGALRVMTPRGVSSLRLFMVDDLPTVAENGKNGSLAEAQPLSLPAAAEGACEQTASDFYRFTAKAGERVTVEAVARRLGSSLDPLVRLLDAKGRELVWCDDSPGASPDCRFEHAFTADGEYVIEVRDTSYQGGPEFRYRLRLSVSPMTPARFLPPAGGRDRPRVVKETELGDSGEPAFHAESPVSLEGSFGKPKDVDHYTFDARKGDRLLLRARTRSLGFPCDAVLRLEKPDGSRVGESISAGPDEATLSHVFSEDGAYQVRVQELNGLGGPGMEYRVDVMPDSGFSLAVEVEKVDASASGEFELKVTCARRDYKGPVTLAIDGLGDGVKLSGNVIKEGQTETKLKAKLPEGFKAEGAANFSVVGRPKVGEREYETTATTAPAWKKLFPLMLYPPPEFDGMIGLCVKRPTGDSPAPR